jgi:hypothetical protein
LEHLEWMVFIKNFFQLFVVLIFDRPKTPGWRDPLKMKLLWGVTTQDRRGTWSARVNHGKAWLETAHNVCAIIIYASWIFILW